MTEKKRLVLDGVDLLLLAAIVGLSLAIVILLLPMLPGLGLALLGGGRVVVRFWKWPWWIWLAISVSAFAILAWVRSWQG